MTSVPPAQTFGSFAAIVIAVIGLVFPQGAHAQDSIEVAELKAALAAVQKQVERERDRADAAVAKAETLTLSLAEANRVREEQAKAHNELQLKMQALGVDLLKMDGDSLEGRLIKAVRQLDGVKKTNSALHKEVTELSEVLFHHLQKIPEFDVKARQMTEAALKQANEVLGKTTGPAIIPARKLADGKVVSIDPEVGLIVLNIGRNSGARIGMPIEVLQNDQSIGSAMVVDVRDEICGALLQELFVAGADVKVGDSIQPRPNRPAERL